MLLLDLMAPSSFFAFVKLYKISNKNTFFFFRLDCSQRFMKSSKIKHLIPSFKKHMKLVKTTNLVTVLGSSDTCIYGENYKSRDSPRFQ